jgi:hypothetical protein
MPYARKGEGLHLSPLPETLNRACPDVKNSTQRMSKCEALYFDTWRLRVTPEFLLGT